MIYDNPPWFGAGYAIARVPSGVTFRWQNQAMLSAIQEVEARRVGRPMTADDQTKDLLREARSGAMYGLTPDN